MSLRNFAACVQLSALAVGVRLVRKPPFAMLRPCGLMRAVEQSKPLLGRASDCKTLGPSNTLGCPKLDSENDLVLLSILGQSRA